MKAIELFLNGLVVMWCTLHRVVLTIETVDEIPKSVS